MLIMDHSQKFISFNNDCSIICYSSRRHLLGCPVVPSVFRYTVLMVMNLHVQTGQCYYPSVRTENKDLLALLSIRQGRWIDYNFKSEITGTESPFQQFKTIIRYYPFAEGRKASCNVHDSARSSRCLYPVYTRWPKKVSHYQKSSLNRIKNRQCGYISR